MPSSGAAATDARTAAGTARARIVASFGRHYWIRKPSGDERVAVTRGKRTDLCVGDEVEVRALGPDQAVIESLLARTTLLQRSDGRRTRLRAGKRGRAAGGRAGRAPCAGRL